MAQSALSLSAQAAVDTHIADSSDAHDASAISIADAGGYFAGDTVEAITQVIGQELADGWIDDTAATWTYASATTFTVAGDRTAVFRKGTRIKLTQTTVKYFVVIGVSHSAGTTTVTITGGTDYTLANAAISANFYSYAASPQGYPVWFNYTPTYGGFSAAPTPTCKFAIFGTLCHFKHNTAADGTSNATTFTISLPVSAINHAGSSMSMPIPIRFKNNSATSSTVGLLEIADSTTLTLYTSWGGGAWTNSGTKTAAFELFYEF